MLNIDLIFLSGEPDFLMPKENALITGSPHQQLNCISGSSFCDSGCWFLQSGGGCRNGRYCQHCHADICCDIAEARRRDIRKEHSRIRPSKKKRDQLISRAPLHSDEPCTVVKTGANVMSLTEIEELFNMILTRNDT